MGDHFITVFEHDGGDAAWDIEPCGPFVHEHYLDQATRENAEARASCVAFKDMGWRRIAFLDFDLGGDPSEPHVVVMSCDGVNPSRPLVWESYLNNPACFTREAAQRAAAALERSHYRYGAGRVARVVYVTEPVPWPGETTTTEGAP